jgi:hypothetical protein
MATRQEVLRAYANNPLAELTPSEEAINYWMGAGLDNFDQIVRQVRAENPTLARQIDSQRSLLGVGQPTGISVNEADALVKAAYADIGRTGTGGEVFQIDPQGLAYWKGELTSGRLSPDSFQSAFDQAVSNYLVEKPTSPYTTYVEQTQDNVVSGLTGAEADAIVRSAYGNIGRVGVGSRTNQIDPQGLAYWTGQLMSGQLTPENFRPAFNQAVRNYIAEKPTDRYTSVIEPMVNAGLLDDFSPTQMRAIPGTGVYDPFATRAPYGAGRFGAQMSPLMFTPPAQTNQTIPTMPNAPAIFGLVDLPGQVMTTPVIPGGEYMAIGSAPVFDFAMNNGLLSDYTIAR